MYRPILTLLGTLALPTLAAAQPEVVALTAKTQYLVQQQMDGQLCKQINCKINHQVKVSDFAGGAAWDGRLGGAVWVSNGTILDTYFAPGTVSGCKQRCAQQKVPMPAIVGIKNYCTGMTFLQSGPANTTGGNSPYGLLFFTYASGHIGWARTKGCTLDTTSFKYCDLKPIIGNGARIGGLAVDVVNRRLFVGTTTSTTTGNVVTGFIFPADNPCKVFCKFPILVNRTVCTNVVPLRQITGMTYDACSQTLYFTDGVLQTVYGQMSVIVSPTGISCRWIHRGCCKVQVEEYTGLAMVPKRQSSHGKSCTVKSCNACSTVMRAQTTGDAVMGNPNFSLDLVNAPSNYTIAALAIGLGPCSAPGIPLGFCDTVKVGLAAPGPFVFFFPGSTAVGSCNGGIKLPISIPVNASICKIVFSFQWVVACKGNPTGNGITNCVSVPFSGI